MSTHDGQSDFVKQVLESDGFRYWLPANRQYVDVDSDGQAIMLAIIICGFSLIFGVAFPFGQSNLWIVIKVSIALVVLIAFLLRTWSHGGARSVRFSKDHFEIRTSTTTLFEGEWADILNVQRIKPNEYQLKTLRGDFSLIWPIFVTNRDGYAHFLRSVLQAMAKGADSGDFRAYQVPIELENGKSYRYEFKPNKEYWLCLIGLILIPILGAICIAKSVNKHDWFEVLTSVLMMAHWPLYWKRVQIIRTEINKVTITVDNDLIHVHKSSGITTVSNRHSKGNLTPNTAPFPFIKSEVFGVGLETTKIDRRFLVPISN